MNITTLGTASPNTSGAMTTNTMMMRSRAMTHREDSKSSRMTVPALPMPVAILLCVLNCLIPGFGTFLSGFFMCCCGNKRDMTASDLMACACIQVLIAFAQLICTPFFLMGWIWSIIWGIAFVGQSADFYHNDPGRLEENPSSRVPQRSFSMTFRLGSQRVGPVYPTLQPPPYQETNPNLGPPPPPLPPYDEPPPAYEEVAHIPTLSGALPGQPQMEPPCLPRTGFSHPGD